MNKLIIIMIWGALSLIIQGTIIGSEEGEFETSFSRKDFFIGSWPTLPHLTIKFDKSNITKRGNVGAIVNPANFELEHGGGVAGALAIAYPEWSKRSKRKLTLLGPFFKFNENGMRAFITATYKLEKKEVKWIINAVGPQGSDQNWKEKLEKTYIDTLTVAHKSKLTSLIFPPISTGIFSQNKKGEVIITPTQAAQTAISAIKKFFQNNKQSSIENIYFTSGWDDGHTHLLAYKKALGVELTNAEKNNTSEKQYIKSLETNKRDREWKEKKQYILKKLKTVLGVGTLVALFYLGSVDFS